jgi:hypothetical protein
MEITRVASMKRQAASYRPLTSKLTTAPKAVLLALGQFMLRVLGKPA